MSIKQKLTTGVLCIVISTIGLSCMMPDTLIENENYVEKHIVNNTAVMSTNIETDTGVLHYTYYHGSGDVVLVYVHGTPGDWRSLSSYLIEPELNKLAAISLSIDRPGWGQSSLKPNDSHMKWPIQSLAEQSQSVGVLLSALQNDYPDAKIILVGHSLGGSLVARLAMDYPNTIDGVLILAGGIDPDLSGRRWYNVIADTWLLKILLPKDLNRSNLEMMILQQDLEAMRPLWPSIKSPIQLIQGDKDKLVNPKHSRFAAKHLPEPQLEIIQLADQGHFIPWQQQTLVVQAIKRLAE